MNWQVNDFAGEGGSSIQTIRWKNGWKWHGLRHGWKIHGCTQEAPSQSTEFLLPIQKVNSVMQYPPGSFFFSSWVFFDPMPIFSLQWCVLILKWVQQQLSACYNCVSPCALVLFWQSCLEWSGSGWMMMIVWGRQWLFRICVGSPGVGGNREESGTGANFFWLVSVFSLFFGMWALLFFPVHLYVVGIWNCNNMIISSSSLNSSWAFLEF